MPTVWQRTTYDFSGTATVAPANFDGFAQDGAFGSTYYPMQKNGSGQLAVDYARVAGVKTYGVRAEAELTQMVGIKYTARATDGTSAVVMHGVCARHIASTVNTNYRNCYMAQVARGTGNNTLKILRGGTELGTITATTTVGTSYTATLKTVPNGSSTDITARLYASADFVPDDPEGGTPLYTVTASDSTSALQALGNWGIVNLGQFLTTPDWDIEEAYVWTEVDDTEGPALVGAEVAPDGQTVICRFAEATLPLVATGGTAPTVSGLTVQARAGRSGAWTTMTHSGGEIITDPVRGAAFVRLVLDSPIVDGYDVQVSYAQSTGNLYDSVAGTPNEASNATVYGANFSRVQAVARTGDVARILGTRGWLRVTELSGSTGKEAQCTREILLPYGCSADGLSIAYEGYSSGSLTVKILGAGVRAVQPDGTVSTHTLSFSGSGTPTIAVNAVATATIAQAFPPGTRLFVTTWYKENGGGLLPYQLPDPLTSPHAGSYDGNAAESGNIGALSSKILLGGTSSGPSHTADAVLTAGSMNLANTYGPAFVYGKPYEYFSGDDDAFACVGNSTTIRTALAFAVADRAFGNHQMPYDCVPTVIFGIGGATQSGFISALADSDAVQLALGTNEATCLVNWSMDGYGHNEARANGRLSSPAYGPATVGTMLWTNAETIAAVFSARGTSHLKWDVSPIENIAGGDWMAWNASDELVAYDAMAAYNALLETRYDTLPAVGMINTRALAGATYQGGHPVGQDAQASVSFDSKGYEDDLWAAGSGTDGIHHPANLGIAIAMEIRRVYDRIKSAGTGGGGSTTVGDGTMTIEKTITMSVTDDWAEVVDTADGSSISGRQFYIGLASETDSVFLRTGTSLPGESDPGRLVNIYNNKVDEVGASSKLYIKSSRTMTALPIDLGPAA